MQTDDHDDETLEPHADQNHARDEEQRDGTSAQSADPEHLRNKNVADQERPIRNGIGTVQTIPQREGIVAIAAVPSHESLDAVAVGDDQSGSEHDFRRVLQMAFGDEIFKAVNLADGDGQHQHHGEAGIDGASDEVGWENRGVPSGDDANREVKAHDGVDRQDQGRCQSGKQQIHRLVAVPVSGRAAPSERENAVNNFQSRIFGAVAQRRQIGDQADKPEQRRNRGVSGDGEDVPHERTAELRPYAHGVGDGEEPVGEPGTADVNGGEDARAGDREERHRFCKTVDRVAP